MLSVTLNTRALKWRVVFFCVLALGIFLVPMIGSLAPSEVAKAGRPGIDVSGLIPGSYIEKKYSRSSVFVVRRFDESLFVFEIVVRDGQYWLPDLSWNRPFIPCADFGFDGHGQKISVGGSFACRDSELSDFWATELNWDHSGKNLGKMTEDIPEIRFSVEAKKVLLHDYR